MRAWMAALFLFLVAGHAGANPLLGTWSAVIDGQPTTVVFRDGGSGLVDGSPMQWQAMGAMLFVEQDGQVASYSFRLQGDRLSVSGGDFADVVVFSRGAAAARQAPKAVPTASRGTELVGKWCKGGAFSAASGGGSSSMTCFELKADGTYLYEHEGSMSAHAPGMWGGTSSQSTDAGRWSVSGNRLTAHSNGGTVSAYALEKRNHPKNRDPMLCLDGECYTTYWQRAPW